MSVIAVKHIPVNMSLQAVMQHLVRLVDGSFESLGFKPGNRVGMKPMKTCFLKLSSKLDPMEVIRAINNGKKYIAFLPSFVPGLSKNEGFVRKRVPIVKTVKSATNKNKVQLANKIPEDLSPGQVLVITHAELMMELQAKYTGLFNLSKKTSHKLLESIARTLYNRLAVIAANEPSCLQTGFRLSKSYRFKYPHFGDFQMILSTLHRLQDEAAASRTHVSYTDLTAPIAQPCAIDNIPYGDVAAACNKYSDKIVTKLTEHISKYNTEITAEDTDEEIAKKKVQEELKKIFVYLPEIVKEVTTNHFAPRKGPFHRVRMYGEPYMPSIATPDMKGLLARHRAAAVRRSDRMFNLLRFNVPPKEVASLMAMDGTEIGDAKMVIRSSERPLFFISKELKREMMTSVGEKPDTVAEPMCEDEDIEFPEDRSVDYRLYGVSNDADDSTVNAV